MPGLVDIAQAWFSTLVAISGAIRSAAELPRGRDWETVKEQVGDLVSAATIVTFLAGVQSQIIALSYQDSSTRLKTATNALGFTGVLLDVTSACLGLTASTVLQRHIAVVEKQLDAIEDASPEQLQDTMRFLAPSRAREGLSASSLFPGEFPDVPRRALAKATARAAVLQKQHTEDGAGESTHPTESPGLRIEAVPKS
ncbi:hypothetical protein B0H16DRAFT_104676 [Mycena metata]|uniref:Uncharacterized protein n=1 Tax=Mycena metata TaxID=1033252 RepID=A0AAD7MY19_9AGAR|nr:hypothetical protein B0H16DRAFT_104676 [Mycena metata]